MGLVFLCDVPSALRDGVERALVAAGHRVQAAPDPTSLGSLIRTAHDQRVAPDCVYLDEAACGGQGGLYAVAQRLRGSGALPVATLAVIARTDPESRAAVLRVVDDVVSKPAHTVELAARIESLLRRPPTAIVAPAAAEDAASGLSTREVLDARIVDEWRRSSRYTEPLALVIVGLDLVNAPLLERALRDVGAALRRALRQIDVLGRFGPTEVAALLVNTHLAGALTCAERLRREAQSLRVEVTMGLALFPGKDVTSGPELVRVASRALDLARSEGPGSICVIQHQGYLFEQRPV